MTKYILLALLFISYLAPAQSLTVPSNIYFADQHLVIRESGQKEIQRMVDALTRYPKYYQVKVDLADTYFPIIEKIFKEEGLPDDFKYLCLQESGLNGNAVSTSNAVGFWQFKKEAASDYGLSINQDVDMRKHIIESSRGAARYLVKNNTLYYKNWHNTLLSYLLGYTGAKSYAKPTHAGQKEMEVTDKTHHYILTYLAHKVAFENAVGKNPMPQVMLQEMPGTAGKTLDDIALETQIPVSELQKYNQWLSAGAIPADKAYTVIIPVTSPEQRVVLASQRTTAPAAKVITAEPAPEVVTVKIGKREIKKLNGLKVIIAAKGDTKDKLASQARMSTRKFLSLNDMHSFDPIMEGQAYYIVRKKGKADVKFHVVKQGERVQQIAQKYGVRVKSILWYNRMKSNEVLAAGRLLWMQKRRPSNVPVEFQKVQPEAEPVRLPANPVILAKDEVLDELNGATASSSQMPDANKNPTKEYPGGKLSGTQPATDAIPASTVASSEKTKAIEPEEEEEQENESPVDVAIAQTNEHEQKTEIVLSENIDKQVDNINTEPAPALYKKPATTADKVAKTTEWVKTENLPAVKTAPVETKPTVVLKEPVAEAKKEAPKSVFKEPAVAEKTVEATSVFKEEVKAPEPIQQTPGIHVVAKGETLYGISRQYNISQDNLKNWNNLGDSPLGIGQTLKVIEPAITSSSASMGTAKVIVASTSPATHTVSAGESMYQISRKYGVTIKEIMDWNNKPDFNVIPGERLHIKGSRAQN